MLEVEGMSKPYMTETGQDKVSADVLEALLDLHAALNERFARGG